MKKLFLVTVLTVFTILNATPAFAQETFIRGSEILSIRNVHGPWSERTKERLRSSNFDYPGGTMSVTETKQASFGGSVSSDALSASLNFNVTGTFSISDLQNIQVPKGKRAIVHAYRIDDVWRYDIYLDSVAGEWYPEPRHVGTH